jgi:hypothetical protein
MLLFGGVVLHQPPKLNVRLVRPVTQMQQISKQKTHIIDTKTEFISSYTASEGLNFG